jgi:hypothetical protein
MPPCAQSGLGLKVSAASCSGVMPGRLRRRHRYPEAVSSAILPTGAPLAGRWVQLAVLSEADLDEMYPVLADPAVYAQAMPCTAARCRGPMPAT